jgi:putative CocE/NonD family hydrolase
MTDLYLTEGGKLDAQKPLLNIMRSYVYNPADPVPIVGGNNLIIQPCGPQDQRGVENRSDVLLFTSEVLSAPLAITGPIQASLFVSAAAVNDTDFTGKLTDVYPDGTSLLIQVRVLVSLLIHSDVSPDPFRCVDIPHPGRHLAHAMATIKRSDRHPAVDGTRRGLRGSG